MDVCGGTEIGENMCLYMWDDHLDDLICHIISKGVEACVNVVARPNQHLPPHNLKYFVRQGSHNLYAKSLEERDLVKIVESGHLPVEEAARKPSCEYKQVSRKSGRNIATQCVLKCPEYFVKDLDFSTWEVKKYLKRLFADPRDTPNIDEIYRTLLFTLVVKTERPSALSLSTLAFQRFMYYMINLGELECSNLITNPKKYMRLDPVTAKYSYKVGLDKEELLRG